MNIISEDLKLRAIEIEDMDFLKNLVNNPKIEKMLGGSSFPTSSENQLSWYHSIQNASTNLRLMIETKQDGVVGTLSLSDIDYRNRTAQFHIKLDITKDINGKGYGSKSTNLLIEYAFNELNLNCIYSYILDYNFASKKMHEKLGFEYEGTLRNRVYKLGKYQNIEVWSLLKI